MPGCFLSGPTPGRGSVLEACRSLPKDVWGQSPLHGRGALNETPITAMATRQSLSTVTALRLRFACHLPVWLCPASSRHSFRQHWRYWVPDRVSIPLL